MQACDLEYLENLRYLEDFAFLCKILHDNAGLYKILQNFEMRVFLMPLMSRGASHPPFVKTSDEEGRIYIF